MIRLTSVIVFLFASILSEAMENREQDIKGLCDKFQITEKAQLEIYALAILETSHKTMDVSSLVSKTEEAINEKRVQENIFRAFSGFTDEELRTLRAIYENPVYQKVNYELFASVGHVVESTMRELLEFHGEEKKQLEQPAREIIEITEDNFCSEILLSKQPIAIDFYTSRCVPCRFQARALDALNQKYGKVIRIAKVNCDQQRRLAEYFEIRGVPSLLFFKPSEGLAIANRIVGLLPEEDLDKEFLKFQ
jgi:thioredoxin 1